MKGTTKLSESNDKSLPGNCYRDRLYKFEVALGEKMKIALSWDTLEVPQWSCVVKSMSTQRELMSGNLGLTD